MSKKKFMRQSRASGSDKHKIDRLAGLLRSRGCLNLDVRQRAVIRCREERRADG
jgi:hypothetical protein